MRAKPKIAIVGPGRLGRVLVLQLTKAGYHVAEIVSRSKPTASTRRLARAVRACAVSASSASLHAGLIWFCVPDAEIARSASVLAARTSWKGKVVFHASGALASDELGQFRKLGASVAAVHPLMTFVTDTLPSLDNVAFAVEGDRAAVEVARRVVRDLGGEFFRISKARKAAYHAFGAFTSPLVIALLATAEQVARAAGMSPAVARRRMLPIVTQTLANYMRLDPAEAFTGPIVRGDTAVVRKHLQALSKIPEASEVYRSLVCSALRYLPARKREELSRLLGKRK